MANTKVTSRVLANDAVLTANIADDQVTTAKIADDVALGGNPTTTTQTAGNNTTRIATTAFVTTAVANIVDSAPSALDTLNELAAALGDDANFSTTVTNSIATKLPLAGGTMTGNIIMGDDTSIGIADDAERIEFDGAGDISLLGANVGIGTTSPRGVLDLGSGSGDGTLDNTPANYQLILEAAQSTTGDIGRNIAFVNSTNDVSAAINSVDGGAGLTQDLMFAVAASGTLSEIMRLDAAGKVGISTTNPATKLEVTDANGVGLRFGDVASTPSSQTAGYIGMSTSAYSGNNGDLVLIPRTSATSRILLMEGNVGIGTTSPSSIFHVVAEGNNGQRVHVGTSSAHQIYLGNTGGVSSVGTLSNHNFQVITNGASRLLVDSSGNVLVNGTFVGSNDGFDVNPYAGGVKVNIGHNGSAANGDRYIAFRRNQTVLGSITQVSSTGVSYNTTSDARLKDVTGEARGLEVINALNPVAYNWKADGKADEGLIAQEVMDIVPNAVSGSEEDMYQMDYSKLVTPLVKAIQEQQEQIETLKKEVEELKGG